MHATRLAKELLFDELGENCSELLRKFSQGIASRKGLRYFQPLFGQHTKTNRFATKS
jgi:hypothetical protein